MANKCKISGVSRQNGHRVSHANNKTKHAFKANIQARALYIPEEKRTIRVKLSTRIIRTIDKIGLAATLKKHGMTLKDLQG